MVSRETSGGETPPLPQWMTPAATGLGRYAEILTGPGIERGLLGPREAPRIWDRHILNCAVVADPGLGLLPTGATVADIGSGAGLPGLVWSLVRPDLTVVLIESLLRRATFLTECVHELGLVDRVQVVRDRAESVSGGPGKTRGGRPGTVDVVTARAVAPLGTLVEWGAPLLAEGGLLIALKGESAAEEVERDREQVERWGLQDVQVGQVGQGIVDPATTLVTARRRGRPATAQ
ncbi:MAG: rRNA methyltransferase GidB [Actinomycetota bacterium]